MMEENAGKGGGGVVPKYTIFSMLKACMQKPTEYQAAECLTVPAFP